MVLTPDLVGNTSSYGKTKAVGKAEYCLKVQNIVSALHALGKREAVLAKL